MKINYTLITCLYNLYHINADFARLGKEMLNFVEVFICEKFFEYMIVMG